MNLRALGSTDWKVRLRAVEGLVSGDHLNDEQIVAELIHVVATSEHDLGRFNSALQALAHFPPEIVLTRVELLARHTSAEVRVACGVLLTHLNSAQSAPWLMLLLADTEPNVVWQALEAVGETRLREATPRVLELAQRAEHALAFAAIGVMGRMHDATLAAPLAIFLSNPQLAPAAAEALGQLGHIIAVPALLQWLEKDTAALEPCLAALCAIAQECGDEEMRRLVSRFLGPNGTRRLLQRASLQPRSRNAPLLARVLGWLLPGPQQSAVVPALLALCEQPRSRQEAAMALRRCDPDAFEALAASVDAMQTESRLVAIASLGHLGDARALPLFARLLSDGDSEAALAAARALGELQDDSALPLLVNHLNHADANVAQALLDSGQYLAKTQRKTLLEMLCSPAARTRLAAVHWLAGEQSPEVLQALTTSLEDPDRRVRLQALHALGPALEIEPGLLKPVQRCFEAGPNTLRAATVSYLSAVPGPEAEQMVLQALQENDIWAPVQACRCLAAWGEKRFLPHVEPLLDSFLPPVRAEAASAWGRLGGAAERLDSLLSAPEQEVRTASLAGLAAQTGAQCAARILAHPDPAEALQVAGHCAHASVVEWLVAQVRATSQPAAAMAALGRNPHPGARAALVEWLEGPLGRLAMTALAARSDALSQPLPALQKSDPVPVDSLEVLARAGDWASLERLWDKAGELLREAIVLVLAAHGQWARLGSLPGPAEGAAGTRATLLRLAP
jgi:HEAT repeat protein